MVDSLQFHQNDKYYEIGHQANHKTIVDPTPCSTADAPLASHSVFVILLTTKCALTFYSFYPRLDSLPVSTFISFAPLARLDCSFVLRSSLRGTFAGCKSSRMTCLWWQAARSCRQAGRAAGRKSWSGTYSLNSTHSLTHSLVLTH